MKEAVRVEHSGESTVVAGMCCASEKAKVHSFVQGKKIDMDSICQP